MNDVGTIIIGQGLAGTALAWQLEQAGQPFHIIDEPKPDTASRVAAGLMTPVTGKRMVCSPEFDEEWAIATAFYESIETRLKTTFLSKQPILRIFDSEDDRDRWLERSDTFGEVSADAWTGRLEEGGPLKVGVEISLAGRVDVQRYLNESKAHFSASGRYTEASISFDGDVTIAKGSFTIPSWGVKGQRLVLCQGAVWNELFPKVPNNPAKGEILRVSLQGSLIDRVTHRSIWVAPEGSTEDVSQKEFTVGATYDWRDLDTTPSEKGEDDLRRKLGYLLTEEPTIQDHVAAVRPTMKDREPVLGEHPNYSGLWVFNGLGSKGTLKAPSLSGKLMQAMFDRSEIPGPQRYQRLLPRKDQTNVPLTTVAQQRIGEVVKEGDVVVDGTVGRGFDTAFLSQQVGVEGRVIGFDRQAEALESTRRRLASIGVENVELHQRGHEEAAQVLGDQRVNAAMFNFGFLPKSDKRVITSAETTIPAISAIFERLNHGGRMTLLCYRGHEGGPEEYEAVATWLKDRGEAKVERLESGVAKATSPVLFVVYKPRGES